MDLASLPSEKQLELCGKLLGRLEKKEYAALVWGFTDGAFTEDELDDEAQELIGNQIETPSEIWDALCGQRLLLRLRQTNGVGNTRYRTRFAETVRLLFRLRQLFPPRRTDTLPDWLAAKTLVADYRLVRKPRTYPRRDIIQRDVMELLARLSLPPRQEQAVRSFTKDRKLSRFQCDATRRILGAQDLLTHQGTIVCAGTGTGKTLAFYLPVFARLVDAVQSEVFDTLCLAVYPRNELLKDQFKTAYQNARTLDSIGSRKLRIGVYFGGTPNNAGSLSSPNDYSAKSWKKVWRSGQTWGRICPVLDCPVCRRERDVSSDLIWRVQDYEPTNGQFPVEQLWCDICNAVTVAPDTIVLTRSTMDSKPPDILFTTTEMLNRSLCERTKHRLLGIGTNKLRFVLLDEAHTYSGVSGAQNALVLRRWKHAVKTKCHFVGLSATLREPRRFFAQLIGEPEGAIEAITVQDADKEEEGWEYQLVLRGDPSSQASLLSTSVQTVMLLARMLDPLNNQQLSGARLPPKLFAFTDNLDVTNRFYHTLRDAENFQRNTGNRQTDKFPLAMERRDTWRNGLPWADALDRIKQGQMWNACNEIGNSLSTPLTIDKVNSQDTGVDATAKVIVATSSLEVGYDDSAVGAVVQHKAARGAASFLQRKGRAGRKRTACPWTVVVLSDFGRDRIAYQGYEQLFEPELDRTDLPIHNRYVLKIQAVFALIDYIGTNIQGNYVNHWRWLGRAGGYQSYRTKVHSIAHGILTVPWKRKQFREYLQAALGIDVEQATALLWQSPRALMTEVLPTIVRRMETNFAGDIPPGDDPAVVEENESNNKPPLPEFVTANLFSNLLVPEVEVIALRRVGDLNRTPESVERQGVLAALQQTAPGRVTRRYAVDKRQPSNHWVVPSFLANSTTADLTTINPAQRFLRIADYFDQYDRECITLWRNPQTGELETITVHRPRRICLRRAEDADPEGRAWVDNMSRTDLQWQSQLHPTAAPDEQRIIVSAQIPLHRWISQVRFFCFSTGNPLRTQRFAMGATGTLYVKPVYGYDQNRQPTLGAADKRSVSISFVADEDANHRAAVGYETDVDAVGFMCDLPDSLLDEVLAESIAELRAPYFTYLVRTSTAPTVAALTPYSIFDRDWFAQTALSIFCAVANSQSRTLQDVILGYGSDDALTKERWHNHVVGALDVIFQLSRGGERQEQGVEETEDESVLSDQDGDVDEVNGDDGGAGTAMPRQRAQLEADLCDDAVRHVLVACGAALYETPTTAWYPWLRERLRATLGSALLSACEEVSTDFSTAELYLDIASGEPSHESDLSEDEQSRLIWISESIPGGAGVIEEVRRVIRHEEERFFSLIANALQAARADRLHRSLRHLLTLTQEEPVRSALQAVRNASGSGTLADFNAARETLLDALQKGGISVSHSVANALNVRILHPSSDAQTDALLLKIFEEWEAVETRFQTAIDARVFAFLVQQKSAIRTALDAFLRQVASGQEQNPKQRYNAVYAMLWPRGYAVRNQSAESYNPFALLPPTDPLLLERRMGSWHTDSEVRGGDGAAVQESLVNALRAHGIVEWIVPEEERTAARKTLLALMRTPIDCGLLIGYARAGRVSRRIEDGNRECISFTLTLPEAGYDL